MAKHTVVGDCAKILKSKTGVVIPVYLSGKVDLVQGKALLADTVAAYASQVDDPSRICLSVDGERNGAGIIKEIGKKSGTTCSVEKKNSGKLKAVFNGMQKLDQGHKLDYIAVVDQDGDHFANELLNFIRAASYIASQTGNNKVMVLGRRISRHRPMGYIRGELEELADRMLLDALQYQAAVTGEPLALEFTNAFDEFPDFHSGYKLFSRAAAQDLYRMEPQLAGVDADCYWRHACEAVMVVEAMLQGAYLGVVNRSTINEQPLSTFAQYDYARMVADKIIWPGKRLAVPLGFIRQWLANHYARLQLNTLAPEGKNLLHQVRKNVLQAFGDDAADAPLMEPLFF